MTPSQRARTRALNDRLRQRGEGGRIMITCGVEARGETFLRRVVAALKSFDQFTPDNDPFEEHDFGCLDVDEVTLFWKIDYLDETLTAGADDPSDAETCVRVLTLMLREEY